MSRMTTQQRLDCLLKQINGLTSRQGDRVFLTDEHLDRFKDMCGFKDNSEIAFYVEWMEQEGLLEMERHPDNDFIGVKLLIPGYQALDELS